MKKLADLSNEELTTLLSSLSDQEKAQLAYRWELWARDSQLPPPGDYWGDYIGWLLLAGRGWGKTRVGAETIRAEVESGRSTRIAIIGETSADAKDVMVNGESGILAVSPPWNLPDFISSSGSGRPKLRWKNGAIGTLYDAREPDQLRGPQHDFCFVENTLIITVTGQIPIQNIKCGDLVLTRKGWRRVEFTRCTGLRPVGVVGFSNGSKLIGTYNHPILINGDWIGLGNIKLGDVACAINASNLPVERNLNPALQFTAPYVVETWELLKEEQKVYNLQVEGESEYFANGVLVHNCWFDELAKYRYAEQIFDMAMFGLRLGNKPRWLATTTPRNIPLIKTLVARADVKLTRGRSDENLKNIASVYKENVLARYQGTRLGRQELNAEILEDTPGALWSRRLLDECRWDVQRSGPVPPLIRVAVGVDPSVSNNENSNETGIIAGGIDANKQAYILDDWSLKGSPDQWARKAVGCYRRYTGDVIVAEANNGGEMVRMTIRSAADNIPVKLVHASRGKYTRAEPISALYEQGVVKHVGSMPILEDQMTSFTPDPKRRGDSYSPDRVDALVWLLTELFPDVVERDAPKLPRAAPYISRIPGMGMLG